MFVTLFLHPHAVAVAPTCSYRTERRLYPDASRQLPHLRQGFHYKCVRARCRRRRRRRAVTITQRASPALRRIAFNSVQIRALSRFFSPRATAPHSFSFENFIFDLFFQALSWNQIFKAVTLKLDHFVTLKQL